MEVLDIEKFNPTQSALLALNEECKDLKIKGIDDKEGYIKVHESRMKLQKARTAITNTGKDLRADARAFATAVIEKEKELIKIIKPTEDKLQEQEKVIDDEKEKLKRVKLLPERVEKLKAINVVVENDFILLMDDDKFNDFYNEKNLEYVEIEKEKIEEDKRKVAKAKEDADLEKQRLIDLEKVRADERKQADIDKKQAIADEKEKIKLAEKQAELDKQKALDNAKAKSDKEKQDIIDAQNEKDQKRIDADNREQERLAGIETARKVKEKEGKEEEDKKKKNKKYTDFLTKNGYNEKTKDEYHIERTENTFTLYKKIDSIIIN